MFVRKAKREDPDKFKSSLIWIYDICLGLFTLKSYLMIVANCDMVSSCGTRNFVLSRTGNCVSL